MPARGWWGRELAVAMARKRFTASPQTGWHRSGRRDDREPRWRELPAPALIRHAVHLEGGAGCSPHFGMQNADYAEDKVGCVSLPSRSIHDAINQPPLWSGTPSRSGRRGKPRRSEAVVDLRRYVYLIFLPCRPEPALEWAAIGVAAYHATSKFNRGAPHPSTVPISLGKALPPGLQCANMNAQTHSDESGRTKG